MLPCILNGDIDLSVGSIVGAIVGGLVMGILNNGMSIMGIESDWQQVEKVVYFC